MSVSEYDYLKQKNIHTKKHDDLILLSAFKMNKMFHMNQQNVKRKIICMTCSYPKIELLIDSYSPLSLTLHLCFW